MKDIIRIVPQIKIGGMERGLIEELRVISNQDKFCYHVFVIENSKMDIPKSSNVKVFYMNKKWWNVLGCALNINKYITKNKLDSTAIISSLWKSHLVSFFITNCNKKISFFHSSSYAHLLDKFFSLLAYKHFKHSIFDSTVTKQTYNDSDGLVIPFVFNETSIVKKNNSTDLSFVYIGRINKVKSIDKSLIFIKALVNKGLKPNFNIYGPDEGELSHLKQIVVEKSLQNFVSFNGPLDYSEVQSELVKHTFFLQTSTREGMGATVIQAQKSGTIPIVTPVGEIPCYCENGLNSFIIENFDEVYIDNLIEQIQSALLSKDHLYQIKSNCVRNANEMEKFDESFERFLNRVSANDLK